MRHKSGITIPRARLVCVDAQESGFRGMALGGKSASTTATSDYDYYVPEAAMKGVSVKKKKKKEGGKKKEKKNKSLSMVHCEKVVILTFEQFAYMIVTLKARLHLGKWPNLAKIVKNNANFKLCKVELRCESLWIKYCTSCTQNLAKLKTQLNQTFDFFAGCEMVHVSKASWQLWSQTLCE